MFAASLSAKSASLVEKVVQIPDTQVAHRLLRQCLGPGRVMYALRTLPLAATAALAISATDAQRAALATLVGTPVSDLAWMQATLPVSLGGCGLTDVAALAPVARLGGLL